MMTGTEHMLNMIIPNLQEGDPLSVSTFFKWKICG